ncbi:MAG TPA: hypothetical protein VFA60_08640 [Terriglobales bacterium]|nr:hypothetical protein [Terriglobales bacterium]
MNDLQYLLGLVRAAIATADPKTEQFEQLMAAQRHLLQLIWQASVAEPRQAVLR